MLHFPILLFSSRKVSFSLSISRESTWRRLQSGVSTLLMATIISCASFVMALTPTWKSTIVRRDSRTKVSICMWLARNLRLFCRNSRLGSIRFTNRTRSRTLSPMSSLSSAAALRPCRESQWTEKEEIKGFFNFLSSALCGESLQEAGNESLSLPFEFEPPAFRSVVCLVTHLAVILCQ